MATRELDLDRLLSDDYVAGLEQMHVSEVRARRDLCSEAADALAVLRRLVQGRLDYVHAELERRKAGVEDADLSRVVDQLPQILAGRSRSSEVGRLPRNIAPDVNYRRLTEELDRIIDVDTSAQLTSMDEDDVRAVAAALEGLERKVSDQRRALHQRVDAFQSEIIRRYKSGDATVDTLLT